VYFDDSTRCTAGGVHCPRISGWSGMYIRKRTDPGANTALLHILPSNGTSKTQAELDTSAKDF